MSISNEHLTRQEEDVSGSEFDSEELQDGHDFGSWPELVGLCFTLLVVWMLFYFRG